MIISRTPFRVSLFGGGTDYPEWYKKNKGKVISMAIDKYCYITVRYLPPYFDYNYRIRLFKEQNAKLINEIRNPAVKLVLKELKFKNKRLEIIHQGDLPGMSGLGGSSAFVSGLINALTYLKEKKNLSARELSNKAFDLERNKLNEKVGMQDQIIVSHGGLRIINFSKENKFTTKLIKPKTNLNNVLQKNLMLVYSGQQRFAKTIISKITKNIDKKKIEDQLRSIYNSTLEAEKIFYSNKFDLKLLGELINFQWCKKQELAKGVINKNIIEMHKRGIENGSYGGKLLGAGGGGFFLFVVPDHNIKKFQMSFSKNLVFNFKVDDIGSKLI